MAAEMEGGFSVHVNGMLYVNGMRLDELRAVHERLAAGRRTARMFRRLEADRERRLEPTEAGTPRARPFPAMTGRLDPSLAGPSRRSPRAGDGISK